MKSFFKITAYEIRKTVTSRAFIILLPVLLLLNVITAYYSVAPFLKYSLSPDTIGDFFEIYKSDRAYVEKLYIERQQQRAEMDALANEAWANGDKNFIPEPLPDFFVEGEHTDDELYYELYGRISGIENYKTDIDEVIETAKQNLRLFENEGIGESAYAYRYQLSVIDVYTDIRDSAELRLEYTRGWDRLFLYEADVIYILFAVLIISAGVFTSERATGMEGLIHTTPKGRAVTYGAKLASTVAVTFVTVLLFIASSFAVFGAIYGYSSPKNALQVFDEFRYSPYKLTVGAYFFIVIFVKAFSSAVFAAIVSALGTVLKSSVSVYASGAAFVGLNYVFHFAESLTNARALQYVNIFDVSVVHPLVYRLSSANIFGNPVSYTDICAVLYIAVFISAVGFVLYRSKAGYSIGQYKSIDFKQMIKTPIRKRKCRTYSGKLVTYETYKTLISGKMLSLLAALMLLKITTSVAAVDNSVDFGDAVWREYSTYLAGELTDEKREYIEVERQKITESLNIRDEMRTLYREGKLTEAEYNEYLREYNYAYVRNELFSRVEAHAEYIDSVDGDAWFLYDTGWKTLFCDGFDVTLYAAILLSFAGIFAKEYDRKTSSGGFADILKATKNGRRQTFSAKIKATVLLSAGISILWNIIELFFAAMRYDLPLCSAPVRSIEALSGAPDVSIFGFAVIFYLTRLAAAVSLALFVAAVSELSRRYITIMTVTVAVTLLPFLLAEFDVSILEWADLTSFMTATPALTSPHGYLNVAVFVAVSVILLLSAKRSWNK